MAIDPVTTIAANDDAGINMALLAALPARRRVLELGCSAGQLGRRYKGLHPAATWTGVDISADALSAAGARLDMVLRLDLDVDPVCAAGTGFDLIVLGDVLEHLKRPEDLLTDLREICTPDAQLVCCIPNMSHVSVIERLVRGDIMYDHSGLLDETHLRFLAPRSAFKMLLDAGWLPDAAGGYYGGHANPQFAQAILEAAMALGVPQPAAELNVYTYQLVIRCALRPPAPAAAKPPRGRLSVIVAGDDDASLHLNVLRSPGLREIDAEVIVCRDAGSAAAMRAAAVGRAAGEWLLLCDDNVYFPRGTGFELLAELDRIAPQDAAQTLIGFAGLGIDPALAAFGAGLYVEGRTLKSLPATDRAISLADFAVVLHRDSPFAIDPALGRRLWATDLCLQSIYGSAARFPRIVRVPVFHNSVEAGAANGAFDASAGVLAAKYPQLGAIPVWRSSSAPGR